MLKFEIEARGESRAVENREWAFERLDEIDEKTVGIVDAFIWQTVERVDEFYPFA